MGDMKPELIRIWSEKDIEEIEKHLLIVGALHGDCGQCRALGLDFTTVKTCPQCNTEFKYVASRTAGGSGDHRFHEVKRIFSKRKDLIFIDYDDFKRISGRTKAKKFLT